MQVTDKDVVAAKLCRGIQRWIDRKSSVRKVAIGIDVTEKTVRRWMSGATEPKMVDMVRLAQFLGCEIAELVA